MWLRLLLCLQVEVDRTVQDGSAHLNPNRSHFYVLHGYLFGAVWPLRIASDSKMVENGLILRWKLKSVTIWLVFHKHANDAMSTYAECGYNL